MRSKKKTLITAATLSLCAVVLAVGCSGGDDNNPPPPPPPTKTTYTGTLYLAATNGGHVAVVPVTIDPSNTTAPIQVGTLEKIQLRSSNGTAAGMGGSNTTHVFHDVRLDGNRLYYSAIMDDPAYTSGSTAHLGYVDLTSKSTWSTPHDAVIDGAPGSTGMLYCGSGQTATHFFPMTMSHPAYIDAISKSAVTNGAALVSTAGTDVKRTAVSAFRTNTDYIFAHGVNSPDGSKLYIAVNDTNAGQGGTVAGMNGSMTAYLLNATDVRDGTVSASSVTATKTITGLGTGGATIAFRSTFTSDGKILQAGKDRIVVLNAADLSALDNNTVIGGSYAANGGLENHDVMPTPDGKYAILALRFKYASSGFQDSGVQLYDIANKKTIGDPVSTCNKCHDPTSPGSVGSNRQTCGIDGKLTSVTQ